MGEKKRGSMMVGYNLLPKLEIGAVLACYLPLGL